MQLELGIPTRPPRTVNAHSWISNLKLRERETWEHGHNCSSVSVKTHLSQKMLWTRCFWAKAPLGPGAVAGWLYFYTELLRLWEVIVTQCYSGRTIATQAGFKFSNAEHQWEFVLELRDEAGWEHRSISAVRVLITPTLFPMPQESPPRGSPLTCYYILASWLSSHWNNCPENQNTAFKDTPFVFADHVKKTMTQMKSYLPLKLETSQTN